MLLLLFNFDHLVFSGIRALNILSHCAGPASVTSQLPVPCKLCILEQFLLCFEIEPILFLFYDLLFLKYIFSLLDKKTHKKTQAAFLPVCSVKVYYMKTPVTIVQHLAIGFKPVVNKGRDPRSFWHVHWNFRPFFLWRLDLCARTNSWWRLLISGVCNIFIYFKNHISRCEQTIYTKLVSKKLKDNVITLNPILK